MRAVFKVYTPVKGFTGESAGVVFVNGAATLEVVDDKSRSALGYFATAQYKIVPAEQDGPSVADALRSSGDPVAEARALQREIEALEARKSIDELRRRRDALRRDLGDVDEQPEQGEATSTIEPGEAPASGEAAAAGDEPGELLAPPPENAGADAWRGWVVAAGRGTAEEVAGMSRTAIIAQYGADYDRERAAQLADDEEGAQA